MPINMERSTCETSFHMDRTKMLRSKSISAHETAPLGYLVSTPKALRILLTHKMRDARLQRLLAQSACIFLALIGAGVCGLVHRRSDRK